MSRLSASGSVRYGTVRCEVIRCALVDRAQAVVKLRVVVAVACCR